MPSPSTNNLAQTREEIYQAIYDLAVVTQFKQPVMGSPTFRGGVRKWVDPDQIPGDQLPFLSQFEGVTEKYEYPGTRMPPIRLVGVRLFCWAKVDPGVGPGIGSKYLNWMMEGIENSFSDDTSGFGSPGILTLGGKVQWCNIQGDVLRFPGDMDGLALIIIPILTLWPGRYQ